MCTLIRRTRTRCILWLCVRCTQYCSYAACCTPPRQNVAGFTLAAKMATRTCSRASGELAKSRKHPTLALGSFTSGLSAYEFGQNRPLPARGSDGTGKRSIFYVPLKSPLLAVAEAFVQPLRPVWCTPRAEGSVGAHGTLKERSSFDAEAPQKAAHNHFRC